MIKNIITKPYITDFNEINRNDHNTIHNNYRMNDTHHNNNHIKNNTY